MKKVVIAPDSFKGTLSSKEVCGIISSELKKRYGDVEIKEIPVADGGEGTVEALLYALKGERIYLTVKSPLGRDIESYYALLSDKTAVIEMALASGITIEKENDALSATSFGTGQLIKKAIDDGAKKIIVGLGGSATTDGGTGCLSALGVRFSDKKGKELEPCGKNLSEIHSIDISGLDKRLADTRITVLCDVKNPLYGKNGSAYIFAPQKGADEAQTELLDKGLEHLSKACEKLFQKDYSSFEGAGAAGGLGFALKAFCNGEFRSGIDYVLDLYDFEKEAEEADIIITGEGKLDSQSLMGKVPFGVASRCKGKRIVAVVGVNEASFQETERLGISEVVETNPLHLPFDEIKSCAKAMLAFATEKIKL